MHKKTYFVKVPPSHQGSSAFFSLPTSHVWNKASDNDWNNDKGRNNATVRVNRWSPVELGGENACFSSERSDSFVSQGPESPEHGCSED